MRPAPAGEEQDFAVWSGRDCRSPSSLLLASYTPPFLASAPDTRPSLLPPNAPRQHMASKTHPRSPSPTPAAEQPSLLKRLKSSHISETPTDPTSDPTPHFATGLFAPTNIHRLHTEYESSCPFKHTVVEKLFQDDLLQKVKDEALAELSFSEKETDIYKVRRHRVLSFAPARPLCRFSPQCAVPSVRRADAPYASAASNLDGLVLIGILSGLPDGRPRLALLPYRATNRPAPVPPHPP